MTEETRGILWDVFVSYKTGPDEEAALDILKAIERTGLSCWFAPRDMSPTMAKMDSMGIATDAGWDDAIPFAIEHSRAMVIMVSKAAMAKESRQIQKEIYLGDEYHLRFFPVLIEDVPLERSFKYHLGRAQWLNCFAGSGTQRFTDAVSVLATSIGITPRLEPTNLGSKGALVSAPVEDPGLARPPQVIGDATDEKYLDMLYMAYADGVVTTEERAFLCRKAKELGISAELAEELEAQVRGNEPVSDNGLSGEASELPIQTGGTSLQMHHGSTVTNPVQENVTQSPRGNEDDLKRVLLDLVGLVAIGNITLRAKLGWSEDLFWDIRDKLVEDGLLVVKRGKGGSVRKPFPVADGQESAVPATEETLTEELSAATTWKDESELRKLMLDAVSPDGVAIGNKSLREFLGWPDEQFWTIRNQLLENGLLVVKRGKGGSVRRPSAVDTEIEVEDSTNHTSSDSTAIQELILGEASLEGVGNEDALKKIMLDAIDPTGITIGNKSLREKLGWSDELFWTIRNKLIDDGLLIKGGGKGGSVFRPSHPE